MLSLPCCDKANEERLKADKAAVCRGNAMIELLLCLAPYLLILFGVMLVASLSLGKQESLKAAAWAAPLPEAQTTEQAKNMNFFRGPFGTPLLSENTGYNPSVSAEDEEPVLPYAAEDIKAALTRSAVRVVHTTRVEDGEVVVDVNIVPTRSGAELAKMGLISLENLPGGQTIKPEDLANLDFDFNIEPELLDELAQALGSWLGYSQALGGFSYRLPLSSQPLPLEDVGEGAAALRREFAVGGEDQPELGCMSAYMQPDGNRGCHWREQVHLDDFAPAGFRASDNTTVDPLDGGLTAQTIPSGDSGEKCWEKSFEPAP